MIPQLTEIAIPVRFIFILLGPMSSGLDYHEIGRSIATLMSNKVNPDELININFFKNIGSCIVHMLFYVHLDNCF